MPNLPRRHVEAEFRRPLVFDDEAEVELRVTKVGTTSITYRWLIRKDGETAIEGRHTVVYVDPSGRSAPLPPELRERLSLLLSG